MINQYTITKKVYRVVCSKCGDLGPEGYTPGESVRAALTDHWTMQTTDEAGDVFVCPRHNEVSDE